MKDITLKVQLSYNPHLMLEDDVVETFKDVVLAGSLVEDNINVNDITMIKDEE